MSWCRSLPDAPPRIGVVFGAAHRRGGVERVAWELLASTPDRYEPVFVGGELEPIGRPHDHVAAGPARLPDVFGLMQTRSGLARAVARGDLRAVLTLGAECPPGDVLVVGSVHRAWLELQHGVTVRGRSVPGVVRRLKPWHATMLHLERRYFRSSRPRFVVACSNGVADDLRRCYGVGDELIRVVPNGYSAADFAPDRRRDRADRRAGIGVGSDEIVMLLMANELHRKGLPTILGAMSMLGDERVRLEVVGRAPIEPFGPLIDRLGVRDRVTWHGPTSDAAGWYALADLTLLPARYEPFGLVVVESLATGTPVVVSSRAGAADAVCPGVNGALLDDPDDAEELAHVLAAAIADGSLSRWQQAASPSVQRFEWGALLPRYWELVDEVVA